MKNKGFTLIELLGVLVILGVIVTISVTTLTGISKEVKESNKKSLIKRIELAAEQYIEDYGIVKDIFVKDLITNGYLNADNDLGEIIDPTNNESLNCNVISITNDNDNDDILAKFKEEKLISGNDCDNTQLSSIEGITFKLGNDDIEDKWYKGEGLSLKALYSNEFINDCATNSCTWRSKSNNTDNESEISIGEAGAITNDDFYFSYTKDKKTRRGNIHINIDNKSPEITNVEVSYSTITIEANDGNGSGIYGYYAKRNINSCETDEKLYSTSSKLEDLESGDYKICVIDNVGNTTISNTYSVPKDTIPPTCKVKQENDAWTNQDVEIIVECSDSGSGCEEESITKTYTTTTESVDITVKDKAGNTATCESVSVKLDKDAPTCTYSGESTTWKQGSRTITTTCKDTGGSGCVQEKYTNSYSSTLKTANISRTIKDNAGNKTTCEKNVNIYLDNSAPTYDVVQENETCKKGSMTAKVNCIDSFSGCKTMYGGTGSSTELYSKQFSDTSTTGKITISDNVGNTRDCEVSTMLDNTAPTVTVKNFSNDNDGTAYFYFVMNDSGCGYKALYYRYIISSIIDRTPKMSYTAGTGVGISFDIPYCGYNYLIIDAKDSVGNILEPRSYGSIIEYCEDEEDEEDTTDSTQDAICYYISKMQQNSTKWMNTTNDATKKDLHDDNLSISEILKKNYGFGTVYGTESWVGDDGYWFTKSTIYNPTYRKTFVHLLYLINGNNSGTNYTTYTSGIPVYSNANYYDSFC